MINPVNPDFSNTPASPNRPCFGYSPADSLAPPCVTIITPFYNTGAVFHETARSVLQQSFQQWEWLIINDGSRDPEAISMLEEYRDKDPRIRVIDHGTNQGLSSARNTGFREAQSRYVVQLDSDDLLEPAAVEKWYWFLESYPEFAFCKGYSVGFGAQEYLWQKGFHNGASFLDENLVESTSMIRQAVHQDVGGYDETNRDGLEDWDFWLRCASSGYWGGTVPEYLDWYRRRPNDSHRWGNWDKSKHQRNFLARLRKRYPRLWKGGFPKIQPRWHTPNDTVPDEMPCENRLRKDKPRLLMIVPWLTVGGADKFNLDLLQQLIKKGWEVSIATTLQGDNSWFPYFAQYTPDIFILDRFLRLVDYPRFLRYLIQSRQVDVVLISHSELGYLLLPYLRAHFPDVAFLDFCHIQELSKNGGYPRLAVDYQESLDLNVVASKQLNEWMSGRGADPERIEVCYINVDPEEWRPDPKQRNTTRHELGLDDTVHLILYAARICPQKQPRVFAQTMLTLRQCKLPFVTLVAGDGPDLNWLRSFVKKHKLKNDVRLLGVVSPQRIQQLMAAADLFFLPSQWEGIALTIYEAMACGLPVIGADVGGQSELVTPDCGILVRRSDESTEAEEYASVLAGLLKNRERRNEMGRAGRERVSADFRSDQMGDRMVALLEEAMKLHATQPRPVPDLAYGRTHAAQALECVDLFQLHELPWSERFNPLQMSGDPGRLSRGMRLYFVLDRWHKPFYRLFVRHGWPWPYALTNKIKRVLLLGKVRIHT